MHGPRHERIDIEVRASRVSVGDFALLQGVLDDAVRLAHAGDLLMLPPLPEVVTLRNWLCDQVISQAAGTAPTPWSLPTGVATPGMARFAWDSSIEPDLKTHWLIGDDQNRILAISPPALSLLGWTEQLHGGYFGNTGKDSQGLRVEGLRPCVTEIAGARVGP